MAPLAEHLGDAGTTTPARLAASARRATSPTSSTATACTDRRWSPAGRAATTSTVCGDALAGRTWCGRPMLWRLLRDRDRRTRARPSGSARRSSGSATAPDLVDLPDRVALFGLTRLAPTHAAGARRHRRRPVMCTCSCCTRRRPCGAGRVAARRNGGGRREPAAADVGEGRSRDAARHRGERRTPRGRAPRRRLDGRHPAAPAAGRRPRRRSSARAPARRRRRQPCGPRRRRQQRPGPRVPRAGPPGRGRCETPSSTSSPTTPRSSRATSS